MAQASAAARAQPGHRPGPQASQPTGADPHTAPAPSEEPGGGRLRPLADGDPPAIGPFTLLHRLGTGSMGRVYLGRDGEGRLAAVKAIRPDLADDPEFLRRFRHEVAAAVRVTGPGVAAVLGADAEAPGPWLATAYVDGPSLRDAVAAHGPLREDSVARLALGVAAALASIHAAGLIHRDLKPANVLLGADGPRVIDFGIARSADTTRMTATGLVIGTPAFMAPEQALGWPVTPAADVFSFGATLAYAAAGRPPFGRGAPNAMLYRVIHNAPDLTRVEPPALRTLIAACLAKDPSRRPDPAAIAAHVRGEKLLEPPPPAWLEQPGRIREDGTPRTPPSPPVVDLTAVEEPAPAPVPAAQPRAAAAALPLPSPAQAPVLVLLPGGRAGDPPAAAGLPAAGPGRRRTPRRPLGVVASIALAAAVGVGVATAGFVASPSEGATPPQPPARQAGLPPASAAPRQAASAAAPPAAATPGPGQPTVAATRSVPVLPPAAASSGPAAAPSLQPGPAPVSAPPGGGAQPPPHDSATPAPPSSSPPQTPPPSSSAPASPPDGGGSSGSGGSSSGTAATP